MRRFRDAAIARGVTPPEGASLKRMFAYWEAGERDVSVTAYQEAFCQMYAAPPEALGFAPPRDLPPTGGAVRPDQLLDLAVVDDALVALLESQTQDLRLLDRRLGSAARTAMVEAHAEQIDDLMHRCVSRHRAGLAAALAEASALAGWLALDRADIKAAWNWHERARGAALESGSASHMAHVLGQQAIVLLDARQTIAARDAAEQAAHTVSRRCPPLLASWVAATEAEVLSAAGEAEAARRRFDDAEARFAEGCDEEIPFLMLSESHLERWRGHCLTMQGDPRAVDVLGRALASDGESVRASASLHTDIAESLLHVNEREESARQAERALELARRCGSARQAARLRAILAAACGEDVKESH